MAIKLINLNIEGSKHLNRVIPFLRKEKADVVCLQEVFKVDFPKIKKELKMQGRLFPSTNIIKPNKFTNQLNGLQGVCCLTRLKYSPIKAYCYDGDSQIKVLTSPYLIGRFLVYSTFKVGQQKYIIGTTQFPWTHDGQASEQQWRAFSLLINFIKKFDNFILCGDFNAPRGRDVFTSFAKYFKDSLPSNIISTLDPVIHRKGNQISLVVDTIFYTSGYKVNSIRTVEGLSDHKAIIGNIKLA